MDDLRYPVGAFAAPKTSLTEAQRAGFIAEIEAAPAALRRAVASLSEAQLDTPYRPGGWTVRQVVHHVPDSHLNAYVRFGLALTEDVPTVKPYAEDRWAQLPEVKTTPVAASLDLLEAVHRRWVIRLRGITPGEWARQLRHPDLGVVDLDFVLAQYAWHGRHHTGHVLALRRREGWG